MKHARSLFFTLMFLSTGAAVFAAVTALAARTAATTTTITIQETVLTGVASTTASADPIAQYFSTKTYEGGTRLYTVDDLRIPSSLASEVTNRGLSWLALLRNEISARRGYVFNSPAYRDIFRSTAWYRADPAFDPSTASGNGGGDISPDGRPHGGPAGLAGYEQLNIKFIRRFEDMAVQYRARELSLVLDLPKERLTGVEAIEVWKATGDTNVLTKVTDPHLAELVYGEDIYGQMADENAVVTRYMAHREHHTFADNDGFSEASRYLKMNQLKVFMCFHLGDRVLLDLEGGRLIEECVYEAANVDWLYEAAVNEGDDSGVVPALGLSGVDENGQVMFTNLIYDQIGYAGTKTRDELRAEGLLMGYSREILANSWKYFELTYDKDSGYGYLEIHYRGTLLWKYSDFKILMVEAEYLAKEVGRSLYVLIPWDSYGATAASGRGPDGLKVFKITVLD